MFLDTSLLVNKEKLEGIEKDITCPICQGIVNAPFFCNKCQNNFCYKCIHEWMSNNKKCPFRCEFPEYIENKFLIRILSELIKFKCQKGCEKIIPYNDVNTHFENCIKENFKEKYYESATQVEILKVEIENYKDIKYELEETKNELEEVNERNNGLENELEEAKEEKNNLEADIEELNEKIEELENELNNYNELKCEFTKLSAKNEELNGLLNNEKEKNNNYENKLKSLENEIITIKMKDKAYKEKINELELEKNNLTNKLMDLKLSKENLEKKE